MRGSAIAVVLLLAATAALVAQRPSRGPFDALRAPGNSRGNTPYDGQFTFVRLSYQTLPGGYWYRGQPAWSHGYPTSEYNLLSILGALTAMPARVERTNTLAIDDPEIFKFPVLYLIEPSWWEMTDAEAVAIRRFLDKGGFIIVDDFKTEYWRGGRGWAQFADNMARVDANAQFIDLDVAHPIFHQFFDIQSLDIFPQAYNDGQPIFRGLFEGNDPSKRLRMFVAYNTDISQFWEWSERGLRPMADTNEAYKLGVNAVLYGITH